MGQEKNSTSILLPCLKEKEASMSQGMCTEPEAQEGKTYIYIARPLVPPEGDLVLVTL